jgi:hypothetical protein
LDKQDVIDNTTDLNVNSLNGISSTTLSYLENITSDVQTQIDNINTGSFTIADGSITDAKLQSTFLKSSDLTTINTNITNLQSDVLTKQDTITNLSNIELK